MISNALKYKSTHVLQSLVEITYEKNEGLDRIQIKDNGIGISKENQAKVFDMFFRATLQSTGSGLGLYIVKETIEKLGGNNFGFNAGELHSIRRHALRKVSSLRFKVSSYARATLSAQTVDRPLSSVDSLKV